MTIQVDFWHPIGLLLSFIGTLATFGMVLIKQIDSRIDHQNDRVRKIETSLNETRVKLPLQYQRREDAICFETMPNTKLDAIGARIERLMKSLHEPRPRKIPP